VWFVPLSVRMLLEPTSAVMDLACVRWSVLIRRAGNDGDLSSAALQAVVDCICE
jgi:hypothetical protein